MNPNYEPEFKKKIVRLHLEEGAIPERTCIGIRDIQSKYFQLDKTIPRGMPDK